MSITLFLGAGFSKWAAGLPLANELFDYHISTFQRDRKRLALVREQKDSWDQRMPNGNVEQFLGEVFESSESATKEAVLWYCARRLSEPFIIRDDRWNKRRSLMIDDPGKNDVKGVLKARKFLLPLLFGLDGIITTNYDMLIEYALGTKFFNYGVQGQLLEGHGPAYEFSSPAPGREVRLQGRIPLAKIHGSISWDENGTKYTDGRRGITGHALIVAPTHEKTINDPLVPTWKLAEKILRQTRRMVVFGFAFNQYDHAVLDMLRKAGSSIREVLIIDLKPNVDQARRLWPDARIITYIPAAMEVAVRQWLG